MDELINDNANISERLEGKLGTGAGGVAWPALLAQAQANRDQAHANRDTARAMLLAMQAHCASCAQAPHSDELDCWYSDALDAASVGQRSADVAEPGRFCLPTPIVTDIGTPPATPRCRRDAVPAAGGEARGTPPKAMGVRPTTALSKDEPSPGADAPFGTAYGHDNPSKGIVSKKIVGTGVDASGGMLARPPECDAPFTLEAVGDCCSSPPAGSLVATQLPGGGVRPLIVLSAQRLKSQLGQSMTTTTQEMGLSS